MSGLNRLRKRILIRPTKIVNPIGNSIAVNAETAAPVRNGVGLSIDRDLSDSGLVVVLLDPRRPFAVARLVMAFAVDALQSVLGRRSPPHVGNEVGKGVEPTVANVDSTASVARMRTDAASLPHCSPNAPFGRIAHAVRSVKRASLVALKTAAAFGVTAVQFIGRHVARFSALASANPLADMAARIRGSLNGNQASKLHSCQINFGWHGLTV